MNSSICRHIHNAKQYGVPVVIAINKFATDTDTELQAVKSASFEAGAISSWDECMLRQAMYAKGICLSDVEAQ
jgi:formyltetrahydrofolate synthetase